MTFHQVIVSRRHGVHAAAALRSVDERLASIRLAKIVSNFGGDDWRERQSATLVVAWMSPRFRAMVGWRVGLFFSLLSLAWVMVFFREGGRRVESERVAPGFTAGPQPLGVKRYGTMPCRMRVQRRETA